MNRKADWERILADAIESVRHKPFKWGEHDCALFAANMVEAFTGHDYAEPFRGKYTNKREAYNLFKAKGDNKKVFRSLEAYMDACFKRRPSTLAQRGDVMFWQDALGICYGKNSFFITLKDGLTAVKTTDCNTSWRVP